MHVLKKNNDRISNNMYKQEEDGVVNVSLPLFYMSLRHSFTFPPPLLSVFFFISCLFLCLCSM